jgi:hypothetical protein
VYYALITSLCDILTLTAEKDRIEKDMDRVSVAFEIDSW